MNSAAAIQWWDLVPAIVGAIIGAISAAWPAYKLAERSSKEVLARDQAEREERGRTVAFQVFAKMMLLISSIYSIHKHIEEMAQQGAGADEPLSRRVSGIFGLDEKEVSQFSPEDFSLLLSLGAFNLVNNLQLLSRRQIALIAILNTYTVKKDQLQDWLDQFGSPQKQENGDFAYTIPEEHKPLYAVKESFLDALIVPVRSQAKDALDLAHQLVIELRNTLERYLPEEDIPRFKAPAAPDAV